MTSDVPQPGVPSMLLQVSGLSVDYRVRPGDLPVLRDVSFGIQRGEIVGVVGESGCGKSTLGAALMQQLPANGRVVGGSIRFDETEMTQLGAAALRRMRGTDLAMIFQDPLTSLNPAFTIGDQMRTVYAAHHGRGRGRATQRAVEALTEVGIPDPAHRLRQYPHQLSGGQRQRVMIAMALMLNSRLLVADEPTSALDVTLQAQIVDLLARVRVEHQTSILFISHDLPLVSRLCDRALVMYAGRVVEAGPTRAVIADPQHPYTRALVAASPSRRRRGTRLDSIPGRVPDLTELPPGCAFSSRCPEVLDVCATEPPPVVEHADQIAVCHARASDLAVTPPAESMTAARGGDDGNDR